MVDTEYEILPHQIVEDLRREVEAVKNKLTHPDAKMNELVLEIESLKDSIQELTIIFQKALEVTKDEDPHRLIQKLNERIDTVVTQNETIARGMVAISDKLEEFMSRQSSSSTSSPAMTRPFTQPSSQSSSQPTMVSSMSSSQSRPQHTLYSMSPSSDSGMNLPPPPPGPSGGKKKLGLF